jgi:hypothetical protein
VHDAAQGACVPPGDPEALAAALALTLQRARAGDIDRHAVRAGVLDCGRAAWLATLERHVMELAR